MITVTETDQRFYIAKSTMPNAGLGVFAKVKIEKTDFLEVIGIQAECDSIVNECTHYANRYKFAAEPEKEFKNVIIPVGYAALINQANDKTQQNVSLTHLPSDRILRNPNAARAVYMAIRGIEPGEELLTDYFKKITHLVANGESFSAEDWEEWLKFIEKNLYGLGVLLDK